MVMQKGSKFILKVGDGGSPTETFSPVGGLVATSLVLNSQPIESNDVTSGEWRVLRSNAGRKSLNISGNGVFNDSASEELVRAQAFSGQIKNYQITSENGATISGAFLITSYSKTGNNDNEEAYSISLASAGDVTYSSSI